MNKRNEFLMTLAIALVAYVLLATAISNAIPPEPTEGELEDTKIVGDWNWFVEAYLWGHWSYIPGQTPCYKFDEWISKGARYATYGVFVEGNLTYEWGYDNNNFTETTNGIIIWHNEYTLCNHIYGRASSWFYNWLGQHWWAITDWAEIRI
jgi:hypothetical protein